MMAEQSLWERLWQMLRGFMPEPVAALPGWVLMLVGAFLALILLIVVLGILGGLWRLVFGRRKKEAGGPNLQEQLGTYPPIKSGPGDRRLQVEGVPVRLRLVVLAPAGKESNFDDEAIEKTLKQVIPGLDLIYQQDKPRVRIWPMQLSYEGFANHFHRNTIIPEKPGELSPWVVLAGRAKFGNTQVMVGLAMQALKPTTVGRLTLKAHEWESKLRVRVRD
jgi:hypothetical protein